MASEGVFNHLRSAIETGHLEVGVRLPSENALAKQYGVSRTVIREVLRSMSTLGFTATRVGSGTIVVANSPTANPSYGTYTAQDLLEARPAIELLAVALAAERHDAGQLEELRRLCSGMEQEPDPSTWVTLDSQFHCMIAKASENDILTRVMHDIRGALVQQSQLIGSLTKRPARIEESNREHRAIVEAIAARSASDARNSMQVHLARVATIMSAVVTPHIAKP